MLQDETRTESISTVVGDTGLVEKTKRKTKKKKKEKKKEKLWNESHLSVPRAMNEAQLFVAVMSATVRMNTTYVTSTPSVYEHPRYSQHTRDEGGL